MFKEYNQSFQPCLTAGRSPSIRRTQSVRMTPIERVRQAGPGRVSGKELEIEDC